MHSTSLLKADTETHLVVLKWLHQSKLFSTLIAMENETGTCLKRFHSELLSVRKLCIQGKFDELWRLLKKMLPNDPYPVVESFKQELKELLSNIDSETDIASFVTRLGVAREYLTRDEKREFEEALTAEHPARHAMLAGWSVWQGRYELFERIGERLSPHFPAPPEEGISNGREKCLDEEIIRVCGGSTRRKSDSSWAGEHQAYSTPHSSVSLSVPLQTEFQMRAEYRDTSKQAIRAVAFSRDGRFLAVGTNNQSLLVCGVEKKCLDLVGKSSRVHAGSVYTCAWSGDGRWIATGSNDQTVRINCSAHLMGEPTLNQQSGARIQLQAGTVRSLKYLDATSLVCGSSGDSTIRILDPTNSSLKMSLPHLHEGHITSVDCDDEGDPHLICAASSHGQVWVSDVRDPKEKLIWELPSYALSAVAAMHANSVLVGNEGGDLVMWDMRSVLTPVWRIEALHAGSVRAVDFSDPSVRSVVSVSFDKSGKVIDAVSGEVISTLEGHHSDKLVGVAWRNSACIATCGADARVVLWSS